jgi:hypothetical protein
MVRIKKSRIKETLINTYNKNIDYKISKEKLILKLNEILTKY